MIRDLTIIIIAIFIYSILGKVVEKLDLFNKISKVIYKILDKFKKDRE